jgi:hypothetical protein
MRWVTTHPAADDFTWEQRSAREFKEASPARFYERKARLEEAEASRPPAPARPIWKGPGPCPECRAVTRPTISVKAKPRPDDPYEPVPEGGIENTVEYLAEVGLPAEAKEMIARVLRRIPRNQFMDFFRSVSIVVPEAGESRWLSAGLRTHTIVIDRELIGRTEEEQVAELLPLFARVVINARHPDEVAPLLDRRACGCRTCGAIQVLSGEYERQSRAADAAYEVEVKDGAEKADALARSWQEHYDASEAEAVA